MGGCFVLKAYLRARQQLHASEPRTENHQSDVGTSQSGQPGEAAGSTRLEPDEDKWGWGSDAAVAWRSLHYVAQSSWVCTLLLEGQACGSSGNTTCCHIPPLTHLLCCPCSTVTAWPQPTCPLAPPSAQLSKASAGDTARTVIPHPKPTPRPAVGSLSPSCHSCRLRQSKEQDPFGGTGFPHKHKTQLLLQQRHQESVGCAVSCAAPQTPGTRGDPHRACRGLGFVTASVTGISSTRDLLCSVKEELRSRTRAQQCLQLPALLQPVAVPGVVLPQAPPVLDRVRVELLQLLRGPKMDLKEPGGEGRGYEAVAGRVKAQAWHRATQVCQGHADAPHPQHSLLSAPALGQVSGLQSSSFPPPRRVSCTHPAHGSCGQQGLGTTHQPGYSASGFRATSGPSLK